MVLEFYVNFIGIFDKIAKQMQPMDGMIALPSFKYTNLKLTPKYYYQKKTFKLSNT